MEETAIKHKMNEARSAELVVEQRTETETLVATKEAEKVAALAAKESLVATLRGDERDSKRAEADLERDADVEARREKMRWVRCVAMPGPQRDVFLGGVGGISEISHSRLILHRY